MSDAVLDGDKVIRRYPGAPPFPYFKRGEGIYVEGEDGRRLMDLTAGYSACLQLGHAHPQVVDAMRRQLELFCYTSTQGWRNAMVDELADLILVDAPVGLDRVWYSGCSGSEAIESAMRMSYQVHYSCGDADRSWFICRDDAFHGCTTGANSVTTIPIYDFFDPINLQNVGRIPQHNPYTLRSKGESIDEYATRSAGYLEAKILEIGPERVCAFVAESMLGQLVGNVPPAPTYFSHVRDICDRYGVHLILDEVYVGNGRSGKSYCIAWDNVTPDFVCMGKQLAAGFAPISAVATRAEFVEALAGHTGRVMLGSTYECHPISVAAALEVQRIMHIPAMLEHINSLGALMRRRLSDELGDHPFFRNVRGRGLLTTIEYDCGACSAPRPPTCDCAIREQFNTKLERDMLDQHGMMLSAKFHRTNINPPNVITADEANAVIDAYVSVFNETAQETKASA